MQLSELTKLVINLTEQTSNLYNEQIRLWLKKFHNNSIFIDIND